MSNNQPKETLSFEIGISGTFWDKKPNFSVFLDDEEIEIGTASNEIHYVKFSRAVLEDCEHKIVIKLLNKEDSDTIESEDKSSIVKDMLLNIESIKIDDIDLGDLRWTLSKFVGDDPSRPTIERCVNLGWNGSYILTFSSPFYLWLLENI